MIRQEDSQRERRVRDRAQGAFGFVEDGLYVAVAAALSVGGVILFGYAVYTFVAHLGEETLSALILTLLDDLLLVFILTELLHTIRAIIDEKVLISEPFLVVGVVAVIRRMIVVSAEAKTLVGTPKFSDAMLEIGLLTAAVVALGLVIFMLRHTSKSEPRPGHEPD